MQKLITTFFAMLAVASLIIIVLGFHAQRTVGRSSTRTARVLRENYDSVTYMDEIVSCLSRQERQVLGYFTASSGRKPTHPLSQDLAFTRGRIEKAIERELANITLQGELEAARRLRSSIHEYHDALWRFSASLDNDTTNSAMGRSDMYLAEYQREVQPLMIIIEEQAAAIRKMNHDWMEQTAQSQAATAPRFIVLGTILAVIAMLGGGLHLVSRLRQQALELQALRTHFVAMASHELRTPVTSIKMAFDLLMSESMGALNDDQRAITDAGAEDCDRLLALSRQLLDVTKVQSGQLEMRTVSVDLRSLVSDSVSAMRRTIEEKRITVTLDVELPPGTRVDADPIKATWVMTNLLANALRYSPADGSIQVSARTRTPGRFKKPEVAVSVSDSGPGIAPEIARRIFQPYFQGTRGLTTAASSDGRHRSANVGLGLAIAQEIVAAHGGRIWVEPRPFQHGATLTFTLPIAEDRS